MNKRFPVQPANPERLCWGCDEYCASDSMRCGNGSERTPHPFELFGKDWQAMGKDFVMPDIDVSAAPRVPVAAGVSDRVSGVLSQST